MSCGTCIRWRRRQPGPRDGWKHSGFGYCRKPLDLKPAAYWQAEHPSGHLMTHQTHGADCAARKEIKPR